MKRKGVNDGNGGNFIIKDENYKKKKKMKMMIMKKIAMKRRRRTAAISTMGRKKKKKRRSVKRERTIPVYHKEWTLGLRYFMSIIKFTNSSTSIYYLNYHDAPATGFVYCMYLCLFYVNGRVNFEFTLRGMTKVNLILPYPILSCH